ncbi:type III secretion protein [Kosakonia cowanii]|jgi:chromosome segregation ATPase|uniref:type III secretion protein n=1 Tax=Kosakonia cowanii TaxID=208223 RepID=UPI0028ECF01F|nr:type III secretion protein [Kosakonia cowanii]WPG19090.1 type III secretion protein [Kosakonia cowanii]
MRRHPLPDNDIITDDGSAELQQAFSLLLPIRRQRLRRCERLQRQAEQALRETQRQSAEAEQQLAAAQQHYQQLRESFAEHHQSGLQKQERLVEGLTEERQASDAVSGQRNQLQQCRTQQATQQQQVQHAQQQTQARLRDVEKLEYLMEHSEALR